jgi:hypothetical protein
MPERSARLPTLPLIIEPTSPTRLSPTAVSSGPNGSSQAIKGEAFLIVAPIMGQKFKVYMLFAGLNKEIRQLPLLMYSTG